MFTITHSHHTKVPSRSHQQFRQHSAPQGAVAPDLLAIYTYASESRQILPPTSINDARAIEIPKTLPRLTGGFTKLQPAIAMARNLLALSNRSLIKKLVVIGDGEADDAAQCQVEAGLCRESWISIESINVGGKNGEATLRSIASMTVGGRYFEASSFAALSSALTGSFARPHQRQGITVVLCDVSGSMDWELPADPSRSRIMAVVEALEQLVIAKRHCFGSAIA
jgi:Mg-chelatase subunit ChlD